MALGKSFLLIMKGLTLVGYQRMIRSPGQPLSVCDSDIIRHSARCVLGLRKTYLHKNGQGFEELPHLV